MKTLDRILVPVDFGDQTGTVVAVAAGIATVFAAKLRLLYAIEEVPHFLAGMNLLKQASEERLVQLQADVTARGVACEPPIAVVGRPFDTIVRSAVATHSHLIVMGRGGPGGSAKTGLGTTTARVLRRSARPVLAVGTTTQGAIRRILCPVDGSNPSARGLRNAIQLARGLGARLTVLTVIADLSPLYAVTRQPDMTKLASEYQEMERGLFERFIDGFDFGDVTWDREVHYGHPAHEIARLATDAEYDLIVLGSTGRSGLPRILLGSTAETVCRRVSCSVLTVKREDALSARLEADLSDLNRLISEGQTLLEQGQYEEAIDRFDQGLLKDPYLAPAIEGQAEAHERLGRYDEAADLREQAHLIRRALWRQPGPSEVVS